MLYSKKFKVKPPKTDDEHLNLVIPLLAGAYIWKRRSDSKDSDDTKGDVDYEPREPEKTEEPLYREYYPKEQGNTQKITNYIGIGVIVIVTVLVTKYLLSSGKNKVQQPGA